MPQQNWESLRAYLLDVHEEYQDRNGLGYCKNCEVDHKKLVTDIESILSQQRKEILEELLKELKNWKCKYNIDKPSEEQRAIGYNEGIDDVYLYIEHLIKSKLEI